jgi:hypothetical protein
LVITTPAGARAAGWSRAEGQSGGGAEQGRAGQNRPFVCVGGGVEGVDLQGAEQGRAGSQGELGSALVRFRDMGKLEGLADAQTLKGPGNWLGVYNREGRDKNSLFRGPAVPGG